MNRTATPFLRRSWNGGRDRKLDAGQLAEHGRANEGAMELSSCKLPDRHSTRLIRKSVKRINDQGMQQLEQQQSCFPPSPLIVGLVVLCACVTVKAQLSANSHRRGRAI
jgi:hypothetical protein